MGQASLPAGFRSKSLRFCHTKTRMSQGVTSLPGVGVGVDSVGSNRVAAVPIHALAGSTFRRPDRPLRAVPAWPACRSIAR